MSIYSRTHKILNKKGNEKTYRYYGASSQQKYLLLYHKIHQLQAHQSQNTNKEIMAEYSQQTFVYLILKIFESTPHPHLPLWYCLLDLSYVELGDLTPDTWTNH